ncbi:hypothetical protein [Oscillibacter ruminantium]
MAVAIATVLLAVLLGKGSYDKVLGHQADFYFFSDPQQPAKVEKNLLDLANMAYAANFYATATNSCISTLDGICMYRLWPAPSPVPLIIKRCLRKTAGKSPSV